MNAIQKKKKKITSPGKVAPSMTSCYYGYDLKYISCTNNYFKTYKKNYNIKFEFPFQRIMKQRQSCYLQMVSHLNKIIKS